MQLTLLRTTFTDDSTCGELLIDGVHEAFTLEPPVRTDGTKPRAIPCGTYSVLLRMSPHFACITPYLPNVPDFEDVLIHWGNTSKDTRGCILVGESQKANEVDASRREFFDNLMPKLKKADSITITITGEPEAAQDEAEPSLRESHDSSSDAA